MNSLENLKRKQKEIISKWSKISEDWKKYNDEIIPEDIDFALEIMNCIIDLCEYVEKNLDEISKERLGDLFYGFYCSFYYGLQGDGRNYLDFDEVSLYDIFCETIEWGDKKPSRKEFLKVKEKFLEAKKKIKPN